jgi:2-desacetyl-2-hydroxyethyl bacteriochlorophyllide A dehydrogenase
MQATALITHEDRSFTLEQVEIPDPGPRQVVVRTHYSGVSIGTEFALIRNKISWGPYPLCTGYQGTGIVEAIGRDVECLAPGDPVFFRGSDAMTLTDGGAVSCVSGAHSSMIVGSVDSSHGVEKLTFDVDMQTASMFVMPAVGLNGVDMANPRMGETVVVYGSGLIGLGVVAACVHRGCRVIAVDIEQSKLEIAAKLGADVCIDGSEGIETVEAAVREITGNGAGQGADTVFECTGIPACIDEAVRLCRTRGTFVYQGNYGADPISFHFLPVHGRRLTVYFPCDDGLAPCRRAVLRNMASGALRWDHCISHRIGYKDAPEMYSRIESGEGGILGVTIDWRDA